MKRILLFLSLFVSAVANAQLSVLIADAQNYNDANIITNGTQSITAVKVNTTFDKVLDAIRFIEANGGGTGGGGGTFYNSNGTMTNFTGYLRHVDFAGRGLLFKNFNDFNLSNGSGSETFLTVTPYDGIVLKTQVPVNDEFETRTIMDVKHNLVMLGDKNANNGINSETVQIGFANQSNVNKKAFTFGRDNIIDAYRDIYTIGNKNEIQKEEGYPNPEYFYVLGKENIIRSGRELFVTGRENEVVFGNERVFINGISNYIKQNNYSYINGESNYIENNRYGYINGRNNEVFNSMNVTVIGQANYMSEAERSFVVGLENRLLGETNNIFGYSNTIENGELNTTVGYGNITTDNCKGVNTFGRENNVHKSKYSDAIGSSNKIGIDEDETGTVVSEELIYTGAFGHNNTILEKNSYTFGKEQKIQPGEEGYIKIGVSHTTRFVITPDGIQTPKTGDAKVSFGNVGNDGTYYLPVYVYSGSTFYMFKLRQ